MNPLSPTGQGDQNVEILDRAWLPPPTTRSSRTGAIPTSG